MLIEFVERGIMYRELEKGERRKGERWEGRGEVEIQREPIEPATMKSRSRSKKKKKEEERKRANEKEGDGRKKRMKREREREKGTRWCANRARIIFG